MVGEPISEFRGEAEIKSDSQIASIWFHIEELQTALRLIEDTRVTKSVEASSRSVGRELNESLLKDKVNDLKVELELIVNFCRNSFELLCAAVKGNDVEHQKLTSDHESFSGEIATLESILNTKPHKVSEITTADATDLTTAIALINDIKAKINTASGY